MAQNPFPKALLQEVLADSEQNLERAILPEHMFGDDGDESESAESLVDDEGAVDEVEDFMVPAQAALGIGLQKDFSFADEVAEAEPHSDDTADDDSAEDDEPEVAKKPRPKAQPRGQRKLQHHEGAAVGPAYARKEMDKADKSRAAREWLMMKRTDAEAVASGQAADPVLFARFQEWFRGRFQGHVAHRADQVEKWAKHIGKANVGKRNRIGNVKSPLEELKPYLFGWLQAKRAEQKLVYPVDVVAQAAKFLENDEIANKCIGRDGVKKRSVSSAWVDRWLKRIKVKMRIVKRHTKVTVEELMVLAQKFHTYIHRCILTGKIHVVFQWDEIPMSACGKMGKARSLMFAHEKGGRVDMDASDFKRCATLLVCVWG